MEKGLSRLLAFLREEEERERLEEIERLKPIGTHVGSYLEYRCVHNSSCCKDARGNATLRKTWCQVLQMIKTEVCRGMLISKSS